jgi:hypothetical protein
VHGSVGVGKQQEVVLRAVTLQEGDPLVHGPESRRASPRPL